MLEGSKSVRVGDAGVEGDNIKGEEERGGVGFGIGL